MRLFHIAILSAILLVFTATSCQKKDDTPATADQVQISITSPAPEQVFKIGDSVHINANVTFVTELHGYELKITDSTTGAVLYDEDDHVHDDHFNIANAWLDTVSHVATLRLDLEAVVDHDGTVATKTIYFQSHP